MKWKEVKDRCWPHYRQVKRNIRYVYSLLLLLLLSRFCPTLCDPRDGSPPGSPVPGILQARTLEWGAISFSNAGKWKVKGKLLSRVQLFPTPWTAAHQASPSMGFSRQECWSGVPLPSPCLQPSFHQSMDAHPFIVSQKKKKKKACKCCKQQFLGGWIHNVKL